MFWRKQAIIVLIGLLFLSSIRASWAQDKKSSDATPAVKKIAIVPFTLYAPKEYQFLKDGIYSMLVTRLFWENKVEVLEKSKVVAAMKRLKIAGLPDTRQAVQLGQKLGADYVLLGSVTILGKEGSIDAKLVDVKSQKLYPFFEQCHDPGEIITGISNIATAINNQVFGRKMAVLQPTPQTQPSQAPTSASGRYFSPQGTYYQVANRLRKWYSYPLSFVARGLAISDVDGDGKNEMVFIDSHTIWIYRYLNKSLNLLKKVETNPANLFINVGLYDLDGDGKQEIIISNYPRKRVASLVYKWEGDKLVEIAHDIPWFLKVQRNPDGTNVLLGQRQGLTEPFKPGIYRLHWTGKGFEPIERVCSLNQVHIFHSYLGDVTGDGLKDVVLLDDENYLKLLTLAGSREWKSGEHYYGSIFYIEGEKIDPEIINPRYERIYIPGRILTYEFNKKSPIELIVYQNHSRFGWILKEYKDFSDGQFQILQWDGLGMRVKWKSPKIHGCITDACIGDFDNDGKKELVFTTLRSRKTMLFIKGKTIVIAYDLSAIKIK